MPLKQVLMQIKNDPSLKWPEKMRGDPNKRNRNKYCRFYRDHGYNTDECYNLKQQIENLIRQRKLRNFLGQKHKDEKLKGKVEESSRHSLGEIRVIIGGISTGQSSKSRKTYLKVVQNVQLSARGPQISQQSHSQTQMLKEFTTPMMMPSLLLCLLPTIQPERCWSTMEVQRTFYITLSFNK